MPPIFIFYCFRTVSCEDLTWVPDWRTTNRKARSGSLYIQDVLKNFPSKDKASWQVILLLLKRDPPLRWLSLYSTAGAISRSTILFVHVGGSSQSTLLSAATTLSCLHHMLTNCFVLFKTGDVVFQNRRLITTSTHTHTRKTRYSQRIQAK